jgi:hypothetical protein
LQKQLGGENPFRWKNKNSLTILKQTCT